MNPNEHDTFDFRAIFKAAPTPNLIVRADPPRFTIVAANDAYLAATMTIREQIVGRGIFEAFPDNPDDPAATGVRRVRESIEHVIAHREPHTMAVQRYDVPRPDDGGFEEKYWSPIHTPVLGPDGEVVYVIQRPEDVTEFVRLKARAGEQDRREAELRGRAERMEAEVFLRAQELAKANADLRRQIEERERAEAALAHEQDFLRAVLDHAADGIVACDGDGVLRFFNRAAREFHGVEEQPHPPERWAERYDLYLPDGKTRMTKEQVPLFRALAEGSVKDVEMVIAADGHPPRLLTANGRAITDAEGHSLGAVVVMHDLTDRKLGEEQRERAVREEAGRRGAEASAQRLRESEERFRLMADAVPQIVWITDAQGRRLFLNQQWAKYTGLDDTLATADDVAAAVVHPDDRPATKAAFEAALQTGNTFAVEHRIRSASGEYRWFLVRGEPYRDPQTGEITRCFGASVDIHDRKMAEEAARQGAELVRTIAENSTQGMAMMDARGYCTYANKAWLDMTGYSAEEIGSKPLHYLVHHHYPDGRPYPMEECPIDRALPENFDVRAHEDLFFRKDGSTFPVLCAASPIFRDGKPVSTVIEIRDVTEARRAEAALRESERRFRDMADTAPAIIWVTEPDGRCSFLSRGWYELTGQTEPTGLGFGWVGAAHPDDRDAAREAFVAANAARQAYAVDFRVRRADGEYVWVIDAARPRFGPGGEYLGMIGSVIDITDRKRAERERETLLASEQAARSEAERAGRMKDEFLATLSHELRTPLNAILGWSQIIKRSSSKYGDVAQGLDVIERNARAQAQIIEDLLDMSRIISGKVRLDVQRLALEPILRTAVETVTPAAEAKGIRIQAVLDPLAGPVNADPARLQQVFWNLLTNAVKFTPKGGRVQVLLARVNSHLEASIIDTGEGIRPEFLPHVFDRFRQADASTTRRHGGLGLGLSIVKQLVELHGGSIRAKSAGEGKGSTFTVSLPLAVLHPEPQPELHRRHPKAGGEAQALPPDLCAEIAGVKVLVVDDEPDARALVKRLLEDCNAVVFTASSAAEALETIQAERPDVLVSDIGMPTEDGYEFIRHVRALGEERGGKVPALALTAYARAEDRMRAIRAGFQMHVPKPVEPAELITMVASLAGRG